MSDWKAIIGTVAPTLATALTGTPLAGVAVKVLADKLLGNPAASEDEVKTAVLAASPADLAKIKEAEMVFQSHLADLGVDLERIAAADRSSARQMQMQTKSRIPGALAVLVTLGFYGILGGMLWGKLQVSDQQAMLLLLGSLSTAWTMIISFYFGSSMDSHRKTEMLQGGGKDGH